MSNVAEIGVRVVADASRLMSGMQKALDAIDNFGNKFQRAANKVAAVGAAITALGGKMIADAAKYDRNVKTAVDGLARAYDNLAVRIGAALIPAINAVTEFVARLIRAWDSLSPTQRRAIAEVAEMAAKALVLVGVAGAVVGIVGDLAGLAAVILPVLPPLLAVAAALAGTALYLGALYGAWKEYGAGVTEAAGAAFSAATDFATNYFTFMADNLKSLANFWIDLARSVVDANKTMFEMTPVGMAMKAAGKENPLLAAAGSALDAISSRINGPSGIGAGIAAAGEKLKAGVAAVVGAAKDGIKDSLKNFAELTGLDGLIDKFGKMFDSAGSGFANKVGAALGQLPTQNAGRSGPGLMSASALKLPVNRIAGGASGPAVAGGLEKARALEAHAEGFSRQFASSLESAGGIIRDSVMSAAPQFGSMVSGAMQGGATGGPWGAIAGAAAALLAQTQSFSVIMGLVEQGVGMLAKVLEPIIKPFIIISMVANVLLETLTNIVAPMLDSLGRALFFVFRGVGLEVVRLVKKLGDFWNIAIDFAFSLLADLAYLLGDNVFGQAVGQLALSLHDLRLPMDGINGTLDTLEKMTWENVLAQAASADAGYNAADAVNSFAESLTNVPTGWKVGAARYGAQDGAAASVMGSIDRGGGNTTIIVQGSLVDAKGLLEVIDAASRSQRLRTRGSPV